MTKLGVLPDELTTNCSDRLEITLTLQIKGESYIIPCGNVKNLELDCQYYGFSGALGFSIPEDGSRVDKLLKPFTTEDLIEVALSIAPVIPPPVDNPPLPLILNGIVTKKTLQEELYLQTKDIDVYYRHYKIWFADAAQVLWKQHFPCELFVEESMESVFKQQLTPQIKLDMTLPAMKLKHPMICLGLGLDDQYNNGSRQDYNDASFYDFVLNYVNTHHAHLQYDYSKQSYSITEERVKPQASKTFPSMEILSITTQWEDTQRYQIQLLNALVDKPKMETINNLQAVEGIRHDVLMREPVADKVNSYKDKAAACLAAKQELQEIQFSTWPVVTFAPGYDFSVDKKTWGKDPFFTNKKYRAFQILIKADIESEAAEHQIQNDTNAVYNLCYQVMAEPETSQYPRLPEVKLAAYPVQVEGQVISTVGDETKKDKTYDLVRHQVTQRDQYKIKIPLWDKVILIEEEPDRMHPRFYFPYDRDDKLLIDLYCYKGQVSRVLDWGLRTKLAQKTQGNHVLFGKNDKNETSMSHIYEGENPVLHIKRLKEEDNEHIKLKDGTLILETNWEDS
jgi:hypothetical protein